MVLLLLPEDESRIFQFLGRISHQLFYVLLSFVPVTGIFNYIGFQLSIACIRWVRQPSLR
jgi:hypothetical protein